MHKCQKHPCPQPATCKCRKVRDAKVPIIWIMGASGTGKSTQSRELVKRYEFDYFSIGDILRAEVAASTRRGREIGEMLERAEVVPNDIVIELLERNMMSVVKKSKGYIIDDYPLEKDQGKLFEDFIAPVDLILLFECDDEIALARILQRANDAGENARPSDNEGVAMTKIYRFNEIRTELVAPYEDKIKIINVEPPIEDVLENICQFIDETIAYKAANTPDPTCD